MIVEMDVILLNRKYLGTEISKKYYDTARNRISKEHYLKEENQSYLITLYYHLIHYRDNHLFFLFHMVLYYNYYL